LSFANYQISRQIGIRGYARYDRLMNEVEDSPIVQSEIGSRDQYEVGLGVTYSFDIF
jgi:outer membrane scaffolding protein for murein synthesis (MipA/OmpV family)